ncbi:MAG TPA: hypothetical protein PK228_17345, partial [Saprospiraceae bacterium]|nr:hypothetical protein [Saprospiraceae bacterium]
MTRLTLLYEEERQYRRVQLLLLAHCFRSGRYSRLLRRAHYDLHSNNLLPLPARAGRPFPASLGRRSKKGLCSQVSRKELTTSLKGQGEAEADIDGTVVRWPGVAVGGAA